MEDYYKFKSDIYEYLDTKYDNLHKLTGSKFTTLFSFMERQDASIRKQGDIELSLEAKMEEVRASCSLQLKQALSKLEDSTPQFESLKKRLSEHTDYLHQHTQELSDISSRSKQIELDLESKVDKLVNKHV